MFRYPAPVRRELSPEMRERRDEDLGENHRGIDHGLLFSLVLLALGMASSSVAADLDSDSTAARARGSETVVVAPSPSPSDASLRGQSPGLDSLLRLPSDYQRQETAPIVAGVSEAEWKRRFRTTRETLDAARAALEKTKRELDDVAVDGGSSQWSVAPPTGGEGGNAPASSPLSFKLRQALRQHRVELEDAEKAMRELEIEANLAGVPRDWRGEGQKLDTPPSEVGQLLD